MNYVKMEAAFTRLKRRCGFKDRPKKVNDPEFQKLFRVLPKEEKLQLISPQLAFYSDAVSKRTEILPIVSTLAAGLLVLATLNKDLIPLTDTEIKTLLSVFLVLIPGTLHLYIWQLERTALSALDNVGAYQESHPAERMPPVTFRDQLVADFPKILIYIFYGIIIFLLIKLW